MRGEILGFKITPVVRDGEMIDALVQIVRDTTDTPQPPKKNREPVRPLRNHSRKRQSRLRGGPT